jgi:choline dehydrogenase-like flavoprotein
MAQSEPFDVIIVGSGAGGGMSAYSLTHAGLKVLMLEAGRHYDPLTETPMFNIPAQAPLRASPTPDKPNPQGFYDATVDGGGARRALHSRRGLDFQMVAVAHAGRAHQPLGPDRLAVWASRLQGEEPRRLGL